MLLGTALIFGALSLFFHNRREAAAADRAASELMPLLLEEIGKQPPAQPGAYEQPPETPAEFLDPASLEMTQVEIGGYGYIGYLAIPKLQMQLPVMGDWDYTRLQTAPCRYAGSVRGGDLVIMAHNYEKHFGGLSGLSEGDSVLFTDMDGVVTSYQVVAQDILVPTAVEEMTSGDFDLTLFTCTYGGKSRVTIYCDRAY